MYRVAGYVISRGGYVSRFFDLINSHRRVGSSALSSSCRAAAVAVARPTRRFNQVRRKTVLLNRRSRIKSARRPGHVERGSLETKLLERLQRGTNEQANERANGRTS